MDNGKSILLAILSASIISCCLLLPYTPKVSAQILNEPTEHEQDINEHKEEVLEGVITKVIEEHINQQDLSPQQLYQKLEVVVTKGSLNGDTVVIESGNFSMVGQQKYKMGDKVLISYNKNPNGDSIFYITDYIRRTPLLWLFFIFIATAIIIGRWQGLSSLLGMAFSFLIIFKLILPQIYSGANPILISILGALVIIPATFILSHGVNKKTGIAIISTIITLVITCLLAHFSVEAAKLTGFASEEAGFLQAYRPEAINIKGLLLAGIIIGVLGILDDITISQAAIVKQLKETDPKLKIEDLYTKAMAIGRDHIASMINTFVLVYAGAAMPLLLLFIGGNSQFSQIINYEVVAEEVVRILTGSIGLILAVPITTIISAVIMDKANSDTKQ